MTKAASAEAANYLWDALSTSVLFASFDEASLKAFIPALSTRLNYYQKGSFIHMEQDVCTHLDLVVNGKILIQQIDILGNALSLIELGVGKSIAGNLLFTPSPKYPMTIIALTDVILLPLTKAQLLTFSNNIGFVESLLTEVSSRANTLSNTIKHITRKPLRQKLVDYLTFISLTQKSQSVTLPLSKTALAEQFGVARPSVNRELLRMKKDGLLTYDGKTVHLLFRK